MFLKKYIFGVSICLQLQILFMGHTMANQSLLFISEMFLVLVMKQVSHNVLKLLCHSTVVNQLQPLQALLVQTVFMMNQVNVLEHLIGLILQDQSVILMVTLDSQVVNKLVMVDQSIAIMDTGHHFVNQILWQLLQSVNNKDSLTTQVQNE